jgi:hypothetical protein
MIDSNADRLMKWGGPVSPVTIQGIGFHGMTIRDWFAGMAMQAIYGGEGARQVADRDGRYDETNWGEVVAANAYEMADAMLRQRGKS